MSRFWLHMVYQMQSLFSKVRTFVFVADVAEVTQSSRRAAWTGRWIRSSRGVCSTPT